MNQVATVEEKLNSVVKHTTSFTYDENGNPASRGHDGASTLFEYEPRDLISKITR